MLAAISSVCLSVLTYSTVLLVGLWCWFQWSHRALIREAKKVPVSNRYRPIIGHVYDTIWGVEETTRLALKMSLDAMKQGIYTLCFWCGPYPLIMLHGVDDIQKVLNCSATSEKANEYEYAKSSLREGLLTATGNIWKITRRNINPLFHPRNMEQLMPVFNQNSKEFVTNLSGHVDKAPVNVLEYSMDIALKTICHLIFGPEIEVDIKSKEFHGLKHVVEKIPELAFRRVIMLWLRIDAVFNFLYRKEMKEIDDKWRCFTDCRLKMTLDNNAGKKAVRSGEDSLDYNGNDGVDSGETTNLVEVYTKLKTAYPQIITDEDLKAEMVTFYASGTDTVGITVASILLILAKYPEIQDKVYQEMVDVLSSDDDVTMNDLDKLEYLDQVYKETLRWTLIIPYVARKATEDIKLSSCTIPAGNTVVVCLLGLHMDPKVFPDPEKFDPERFSPENCQGRNRYSFLPFSGGPRSCIGKRYAELFVKVSVIQTLRRYRLTTEMDICNMKKKLAMVLVSTEGYNVSLHPRN